MGAGARRDRCALSQPLINAWMSSVSCRSHTHFIMSVAQQTSGSKRAPVKFSPTLATCHLCPSTAMHLLTVVMTSKDGDDADDTDPPEPGPSSSGTGSRKRGHQAEQTKDGKLKNKSSGKAKAVEKDDPQLATISPSRPSRTTARARRRSLWFSQVARYSHGYNIRLSVMLSAPPC